MKNFKFYTWPLVVFLSFANAVAQDLKQATTHAQAKAFAARVSAYLQDKTEGFRLLTEQGVIVTDTETNEVTPGTYQTFESNDFLVEASIGILPDVEMAKKAFRKDQINGGLMAADLAGIGDEAWTWNLGMVEARKGKIMVNVIVHSKEELARMRAKTPKPEPDNNETKAFQENSQNNPSPPTQDVTRPKEEKPKSTPKREVAERFARHMMDFLESQQ
ncbi:MAG TPA: hypothetical protein PLL06_17875 [Acidobacteriota bacterium]|nr:hypothetical protein [Acidobacteriota bacterium]HMZ81573.1 hypothetical protein [Acidobacteriota bacterium]